MNLFKHSELPIETYIKNLKEASDRLEENLKTLKIAIEELYKANVRLAKENRDLERALENERK